nr:MAG TPA: hypothetical protein [Caudoviricetes sp.]
MITSKIIEILLEYKLGSRVPSIGLGLQDN